MNSSESLASRKVRSEGERSEESLTGALKRRSREGTGREETSQKVKSCSACGQVNGQARGMAGVRGSAELRDNLVMRNWAFGRSRSKLRDQSVNANLLCVVYLWLNVSDRTQVSDKSAAGQ